MSEIVDGYSFLKVLKEQAHKDQFSFTAFSTYLGQKARKMGVPLNGQFELTPLCNFRCEMCYVRLDREQMCQPLLTPDQWKDLIDQAVQAGMLHVTLSGGECLTYPGFREVYEHVQHLGCEVELFSNGFLLDEDWVRYFKDHPFAGIHITLYGDSEEAYERVTGHRAFSRVVDNIQKIREENLPLRINITPCQALGEDVFGTIRLAHQFSQNVLVNHLLSEPREETGRAHSVKDLDDDFYIRIMRFQNELKGIHLENCPVEVLPAEGGPDPEGIRLGLLCGGGRSGFNLDWKGAMHPCNELECIEARPLETGFAEAWRQIRKAVDLWPRAAACEGCAYEPFCESCVGRVAAIAEPGTWPHELCKRVKRFVQQGVYPAPSCP